MKYLLILSIFSTSLGLFAVTAGQSAGQAAGQSAGQAAGQPAGQMAGQAIFSQSDEPDDADKGTRAKMSSCECRCPQNDTKPDSK